MKIVSIQSTETMENIHLRYLIFVIFRIQFVVSSYRQCTNTDYAGVIDPETRSEKYNNKVGWGFVNRLPDYTFSCCGVISKWEVHVEAAGDLEIQAWRPSGTNEQLVGENVLNVTPGSVPSELAFTIDTNKQITVLPGDAIGWRTAGVEVLTYESTKTLDKMIFHDENMPQVHVGRTHTFEKDSIKDRMYAVRAYLSPGTAPTFTNLPASVSIADSVYPGATIFTPTFGDSNPLDTHNFTHAGSLSSYFTIDLATGDVKVVKALLPATIDIYLVVNDVCGLQDIQLLTITVTGPDQPPKLEDMPGIANVHEDTTVETLVYNLTVTDSDPVTCYLTNTVPVDAPFILKRHLTTPADINSTVYYTCEYGVYLKGGTNLSYSLQTMYELNVTCNDNTLWSSGIIYIYVQQNSPPVFINLPGSTTISARSVIIDAPLYNVIAMDTDDTSLTYHMTCNPSTCPFDISTSGIIFTTAPLLQDNNAIYDIFVYVSDSLHKIGPEVLSITITDRNNAPIVSIIPATIYLSEHSPDMTTILSFTITDVDVTDSVSCFFDVWPLHGFAVFAFNVSTLTLYVKPGAVLDFEIISDKYFSVTFTVTDHIDSVNVSTSINIQDENDPPVFVMSTFYVWTNESQLGTFISKSPSYTDQDVGDTFSYKIKTGSGSGYVHINQYNGDISFSVDYDVDQSNVPTTINIEIEIEDNGGLKDMCLVIIYIEDINDNAPTFNATSYTFTTTVFTVSGTSIGTVHATDADGTSNALISYTIDQTSPYKDMFILSNDGSLITLLSFSNFSVGQLLTFKVIAGDNGSPSLKTKVDISIIVMNVNSPLPVTNSNSSQPETLLAVAMETGNSPGITETSEWTILIAVTAFGVLLSILAIGCQIRKNRRQSSGKEIEDIQRNSPKKETTPKPLPTLHRMKSTTPLINDTEFWKRGAVGNEHPPINRSMSQRNFTRTVFGNSQSRVSDLSHVKEDFENTPRIIRTSGVRESRGIGLLSERSTLRF